MDDPRDDQAIHIASRINFSERLPGGIGLRQVVLVGAAVAQAIYLMFIFDGAPFAARVVVAMVAAFVLLALAVLRPRGNSPEGLLVNLVRWLFQPRYRLYQTAERVDHTLYSAEDVVGDGRPAPRRTERVPFPLEWDRANIALILFLFMALMTLSTMLMWSAHRGRFPGLAGWPAW